MNWKLITLVSVLVFGFGVGQTSEAQTVEMTVGASSEAVIAPADAAALKRGLDALGWVLDEIERRLAVNPQSLGDPVILNATLEGLEVSLKTIDSVLTSRAIALGQPSTAPPQVAVQISPFVAKEAGEETMPSEEAVAPQPTEATGEAGLAETERALSGSNRYLWLVLAVVGLAAIAYLWFSRGEKETPKAQAVPRVPNPSASQPPANPIGGSPMLMTTPDPNQERPLL